MREIHIQVVGLERPYIVRGDDLEAFNNSYDHWATSQHVTWMAFAYRGGFLELNMMNVVSIETKNLASATNTN
ncbi:hypothetical protein [Vagococcus carniphilus]|uniref:hypothetical protein n=1 Tax=Vagococcus carniphilus TaxID=218144 RepID=UPI003B59A63A